MSDNQPMYHHNYIPALYNNLIMDCKYYDANDDVNGIDGNTATKQQPKLIIATSDSSTSSNQDLHSNQVKTLKPPKQIIGFGNEIIKGGQTVAATDAEAE